MLKSARSRRWIWTLPVPYWRISSVAAATLSAQLRVQSRSTDASGWAARSVSRFAMSGASSARMSSISSSAWTARLGSLTACESALSAMSTMVRIAPKGPLAGESTSPNASAYSSARHWARPTGAEVRKRITPLGTGVPRLGTSSMRMPHASSQSSKRGMLTASTSSPCGAR